MEAHINIVWHAARLHLRVSPVNLVYDVQDTSPYIMVVTIIMNNISSLKLTESGNAYNKTSLYDSTKRKFFS